MQSIVGLRQSPQFYGHMHSNQHVIVIINSIWMNMVLLQKVYLHLWNVLLYSAIDTHGDAQFLFLLLKHRMANHLNGNQDPELVYILDIVQHMLGPLQWSSTLKLYTLLPNTMLYLTIISLLSLQWQMVQYLQIGKN